MDRNALDLAAIFKGILRRNASCAALPESCVFLRRFGELVTNTGAELLIALQS